MQHSEHINELAEALSALAGEITDARKDVAGYGYKYADLAQCLQIVRPLLSKHGLALAQSSSTTDDKATVTSMLMHKSGQWIRDSVSMRVEPKKGLSEVQCAGMILTYLRRYSLVGLLGLAAEDDDGASGKEFVETVTESPVLGKVIKALESGDEIGMFCLSKEDEQAFRSAFGRLNMKQKATCRELEQKGSTMVIDWAEYLRAARDSNDPDDANAFLAGIVDPTQKRLLWAALDTETQHWIKSLKAVA